MNELQDLEQQEITKPAFRKRLRLVTVDENGNIVDPEQPIN